MKILIPISETIRAREALKESGSLFNGPMETLEAYSIWSVLHKGTEALSNAQVYWEPVPCAKSNTASGVTV